MRKNRKCDTTKYKRRMVKEKIAHQERVKRRQAEEAERYAAQRKENEVYLRLKAVYHEQEQALVNVLAARLYQLSPEHPAEARLKELFKAVDFITKEAGVYF